MKQKLFFLFLSLFAVFMMSSCKKRWDCRCNIYKDGSQVLHIDSYVEAKDIPDGNEQCNAKGQEEYENYNADSFECGLWEYNSN